jgi:hypothetical protein
VIVVLAGNARQCEDWRRYHDLKRNEVLYVESPMDLLRWQGAEGDTVIEVGTFDERKDWPDIYRVLLTRPRLPASARYITQYHDPWAEQGAVDPVDSMRRSWVLES